MQSCPEWLGRDLVAGALPWSRGIPASLPGFLERFTLHDARWIGLYAEAGRSATLLLRWDAGYPPRAVPASGEPEPEWPILALRFDALERSEVRLRDPALAGAVSGPTSRAAGSHRTHLTDRHGGDATLLHAPGVRLLCLSRAREVLPLPVPAETV